MSWGEWQVARITRPLLTSPMQWTWSLGYHFVSITNGATEHSGDYKDVVRPLINPRLSCALNESMLGFRSLWIPWTWSQNCMPLPFPGERVLSFYHLFEGTFGPQMLSITSLNNMSLRLYWDDLSLLPSIWAQGTVEWQCCCPLKSLRPWKLSTVPWTPEHLLPRNMSKGLRSRLCLA